MEDRPGEWVACESLSAAQVRLRIVDPDRLQVLMYVDDFGWVSGEVSGHADEPWEAPASSTYVPRHSAAGLAAVRSARP